MTTGNMRKIDYLMGQARDCGDGKRSPSFRYLLCSTPRCGSNLVSDMLYQSARAGDPLEYLNRRHFAGYLRNRPTGQISAVPLQDYLSEIETRRSTANGYFGIKAHYEHIQAVFRERPSQATDFLRRFDKVILLRRRDKINQAVSLHKARTTQIWSSLDYQFMADDDPRHSMEVTFDPLAITNALFNLVTQDLGWIRLLETANVSFLEVWYEDLVADYTGWSRSILDYLCLSASIEDIPPPKLTKQGAKSEPMAIQFRRFIDHGEGRS